MSESKELPKTVKFFMSTFWDDRLSVLENNQIRNKAAGMHFTEEQCIQLKAETEELIKSRK